eukprot:gene8133-73_t
MKLEDIYMTFGGKWLQDNHMMWELGINEDSTIEMSGRLRGGNRIGGRARTAIQASMTCSCGDGCYHKAAQRGGVLLPYVIPAQHQAGYRVITWNRPLTKFLASWNEIREARWDAIMLQEAGQWSDDCLKWLPGVTAHVNIMTSKKNNVRMIGGQENAAVGKTAEDQGMVTLFKKGQRVRLKSRSMSHIASQVIDDNGVHMTLINTYVPWQTHREDGMPRTEQEIDKLPDQTKQRIRAVIKNVNEEIGEAQRMNRPLLIGGDFNHHFHKEGNEAIEPDKRGWTLNAMFDGHFMYKNLLERKAEDKRSYTYWRGRAEDTDEKGHAELDGFFNNEWAMASIQGRAKVLEQQGAKERDHQPVMIEVDLKVMTQVREQSRNWRSPPIPMDWDAKEWDAQDKTKLKDAVIKIIQGAKTVRELYDGLQEVYQDRWKKKSKGRTGTRKPGEHERGRELRRALGAAIKAKDKEQQRFIKAQIKKEDEEWNATRRAVMKEAAQKDQRFLSEAVKGDYRTQTRVYALKDEEGTVHADKKEVHDILTGSWKRIMTGNKTEYTERFDQRFLKHVVPIDPGLAEEMNKDFTPDEVENTLQGLRKNAATLEIPTEFFVDENNREEISKALAMFYNRLWEGDGLNDLLEAEVMLPPKTDDEFDPIARRPIMIGHAIGKCLTRIIDVRLAKDKSRNEEQAGYFEEVSAEDCMEGVTLAAGDGVDNVVVKVLAYVDDCTIFPKNREELKTVIECFANWEDDTGMKLKRKKCHWIIWPGIPKTFQKEQKEKEKKWIDQRKPRCPRIKQVVEMGVTQRVDQSHRLAADYLNR